MTDQATGPVGPDQRRTRDAVRTTGIIVVGVAAAVLSFQTWVQVAQSIGFTAHWSVTMPLHGPTVSAWIAWLYPVAIDCYAMLVTREWIRSKANSPLRAWAKANSIGAIALSYFGQAAYHAFDGHRPPTIYVIFMGGMPPLIVGLVVHLYTKSGAIDAVPVRTKRAAARPTTNVTQPTGPSESPAPATPDVAPTPAPTRTTRTTVPLKPRGGLHLVQGVVAEMATAVDRTYPDQIPSRQKVMDHFGWKSAAQTGDAIKAVRTKREAATAAVDQVDADDSERELVAAGR